jgi:MFS family permease
VADRRARTTLAGFVALGLFWGAWASVLPSVQEATGASKGALGVAMLFVSLAALPAMLFLAGPAVERFGARAIALGCGAFAVATALPGLATSISTLIPALAAAGAATGLVDVAINANAGRIERESGRRLMPLAHGMYSVGVLVGAVGAGLARSEGAGREAILLAVSICVALVGVAALGDETRVPSPPGPRVRFARGLLLIGLIGAAGFVVEGGLESWSALFLERELDARPAISGLGPGVFGGSMALGRIAAQLVGRFSDRVLLGAGALVAGVGCVLTAAAPDAAVGLVGLALGGIGVSVNAPVVFGFAGRRPDAGTAVATVTTIGYLGLLIGPPLVGGVAQASSLRASFVVLAVIAAAVATAAARLNARSAPR